MVLQSYCDRYLDSFGSAFLKKATLGYMSLFESCHLHFYLTLHPIKEEI